MATLLKFENSALGYSVVFDDDDRVAYAYLMQEQTNVGDVWLYNCGVAPNEPEWRDPSKMPFANPSAYASDSYFAPVRETDEITIDWIEFNGAVANADVYIRGKLAARLAPGTKPGWSRNAKKDGPLAKTL